MNKITAKLYKSGNSYSVRLPVGVVRYLGLKEGDTVTIGDIAPTAPPKPTAESLDLPLDLATLRHELHAHGVAQASIFGSYARGEATPTSDLDLLVTLKPNRSYLDLGGLQYRLQEITRRKVDIATRLNRRFTPYAEDDLVEVFHE